MAKVFIGSSSEAYDQAEKVEEVLSAVDGIEGLLWKQVFQPGDITFSVIERLESEVVGAVFLATPDDRSVIRGKEVAVPRANVIFEYGHLTARLSRARVALCHYEGTELPSDLDGITFAAMGPFKPDSPVSDLAKSTLDSWARSLPRLPVPRSEPDFAYPPRALESKQTPLSAEETRKEVAKLFGWEYQTRPVAAAVDGIAVEIAKTFIFEDFEDAMRFMKSCARLFGWKKHHPDWTNVWETVRIRLTSWDIGHRLSIGDFQLAADLDEIYERRLSP